MLFEERMGSFIFLALLVVLFAVGGVSAQCLSNKTCNGHGVCPDPSSCTSFCSCDPGYTGTYCTRPPDCTDTGGQCGDNGDCVSYTCVCKNKYSGRLCDTPPVCTEDGGECGQYGECNTCTSSISNYCTCNSGYGGDTCTEAPVCTEGGNECKNGGVCDFLQTPFNCTCPSGFPYPTCGSGFTSYVTSVLLLTPLWSLVMGHLH